MQETPATQYLFAPASTEYHLAESETHSVCGAYFDNSHPKRRRDDWRLISEQPDRFHLLCLKCQRKLNGESEPEINWYELTRRRGIDSLPPVVP